MTFRIKSAIIICSGRPQKQSAPEGRGVAFFACTLPHSKK
nr:MAG TPA: hypothetical protein [Caudoviricetes sp.]